MQEWVKAEGHRLVVIFEGRDAAGKGGAIKRITEYLNPRFARIAALPAPTERERSQWYFQRYIEHLPAAGEIVLFDRSWYNRAGVERVMGFCTPDEYRRFLHQCPIFERLLVEDGILLRKYWFSVSDEEQQRRFRSRLKDPLRQWKLSPMDLESITRWEDYSRAKDEMMVHTDIPEAPWYVVECDDKKRARAQHDRPPALDHPVRRRAAPELELPTGRSRRGYERPPRRADDYVPDHSRHPRLRRRPRHPSAGAREALERSRPSCPRRHGPTTRRRRDPEHEAEVVPATRVAHLVDADVVTEQRDDERDRADQPVPQAQPEPGLPARRPSALVARRRARAEEQQHRGRDPHRPPSRPHHITTTSCAPPSAVHPAAGERRHTGNVEGPRGGCGGSADSRRAGRSRESPSSPANVPSGSGRRRQRERGAGHLLARHTVHRLGRVRERQHREGDQVAVDLERVQVDVLEACRTPGGSTGRTARRPCRPRSPPAPRS